MKKYKNKIHDWFGLTYASYLTLPRSVLQSMPGEWQEKFVELLEELDEEIYNLKDFPPVLTVSARDKNGKYIHDPYRDYARGRRRVFGNNTTY